MNRIEVRENNVILNEVDNIASTSIGNDTLIIDFKNSNDKPITLINNIYKNIVVNIRDNSIINIFEIRDNKTQDKFYYTYNLGSNSKAIINKFYYIDNYNEDDTVNLNGENADMLFNLSVISFAYQIYNISVNHNNKKTISNINSRGVTLDNGKIDFIVNGTIKRGMVDSITNQDNKIMTLGNGKSMIKPNLFIDENMIEARHGASIGRFNDEEIFYLESRGIPEFTCYQMLMKGFLLSPLKIANEVKENLENIINKFRR